MHFGMILGRYFGSFLGPGASNPIFACGRISESLFVSLLEVRSGALNLLKPRFSMEPITETNGSHKFVWQ